MKPLNLGIPKGSLEDATIKLFRRAGWKISGSSRSYIPTIDDDDISCKLARPQEMSRYVQSGALDAAITGSDWTLENESDVAVIADLVYSRISFLPTKWVLAVKNDSPVQKAEDLEGGVIATEFVKSTERYFADKGTSVQVEFSWGATEAKAAEGLVDAIVDVTETGSTLRANGLRIVDTLTMSNPQLIANHESYKNPEMRAKIDQIALLLKGALEAESRVGLKLNIPKDRIDSILELLPSITAPTVANLYGKDWFSVEIVVAKVEVRDLIPRLRERGAEGIIEYPLTKIV
jgi:ATP phosphoribosyltransferase